MWRIIQLKSDAEPWWFLDGWRDDTVNEWTFNEKEAAFDFYRVIIEEMVTKYPNVRVKRGTQIAFWCEGELLFCDSCDEDLQLYHGILMMKDEAPFTNEHMTNDEKKFFEQLIDEQKKKTEE
ncbi:DUF1033 family protein [Jeotgalibacillus marinus]|uniref:DUF1033 family protein n=1 Tax=Jeotgalibacillus marinus TaxID=86667 RepID=A0ABV3Q339_9BACL